MAMHGHMRTQLRSLRNAVSLWFKNFHFPFANQSGTQICFQSILYIRLLAGGFSRTPVWTGTVALFAIGIVACAGSAWPGRLSLILYQFGVVLTAVLTIRHMSCFKKVCTEIIMPQCIPR